MRRSVGLAIAAVVLSVTIGVLVGLVIHAGMSERAGDPGADSRGATAPSTPRSTGANAPTGTDHDPDAASSFTAPWQPSLTPVSDVPSDPTGPTGGSVAEGTPSGPTGATTMTTTVTARATGVNASPSAETGLTTRTSMSRTRTTTSHTRTTVTSASTTSASTTRTGASGTSTNVTSSTGTSPVTAHPGADEPDGPCGTLGEKSSTSAGATLFCQHDQGNGRLRWRAVTDGGGCLARTMTGVGLDGHRYACRTGPDGLNHWRRVH